MKIFFISAWFPYPPINGAKIRIYNLIRELAKKHEITLLSFARTIPLEEARNSVSVLAQYCRSVKVIPSKSFNAWEISTYRGFFSLRPRFIAHTYSSEVAELVYETAASDSFDIVIVSEVGAPSVASLYATRIEGLPKILDAIEVALYTDAYQRQAQMIKRIRSVLTWLKYRRYIRQILQKSEAITVPSLQEKYNLQKIAPRNFPIEVIPHCLDTKDYQGYYGSLEPHSLVFTGSLSYFANLDAVRYFLEKIYPIVRNKNRKVNLKIIGDTNHIDLNQWVANKNVTFTGLLKDVREEVAKSWLSIVPLRIGAGTRLKIIESMALGTPVISTSKGAEGLDVAHGENILIADDPNQFSRFILDVLESPGLREKLSMAGRRLVAEKYSTELMRRKFEALLARSVSLGRTGAFS